LNVHAREIDDEFQPGMVGNPMLAQIRDFIDSDDAPPALDPLGMVRRALRGRERRVAVVTFLVALLAAIAAYLAVKPAYQSSGMVRVLAREAKVLYSDSDDSRLRLYDAFVTAEMELLQSRPVLEGALADLHARRGASFPLPGDVGDLASMFAIASKKGLISVAARSPDPQLSAAAVNAVLNAYEASNEAARRRHYDVRRQELSTRERELEGSLAALNAEYLEIGGEHDAGTLSKAHVAKTAQLEVLEERIAELDNTIAQMQATGGAGADVGSVEIQRATLLDKATADMTYERAQRLAALETLRRRYRPAHPKLRAAEGELTILESAIAERREQIATLGKAGALTGGGSDSAQQSFADLAALSDKLVTRRETIRAEAADLNSKLIRIRGVVTEKQRVEELLAETKRALDEVLVESQNDLSRAVEIIAVGKVPDGPIEDKRKPAALGAAVFGGLGTLAFFIAGTVLAGRVRFSDDLDERAGGLLAAVVADETDPRRGLDAAASRLRNEIDLRWPSQGTKPLVIGVVAAAPGAGATSLVDALGRHYAAAGRSTLLIDANAADSSLSRLYGASDAPGAAAVAHGNVAIAEAVRAATPDEGAPQLLAASSCTSAAGAAQGTPELAVEDMRRLLNAARAGHDLIVVDLGVLAAGRQSAVGAAMADRVVLVAASGERKQSIVSALDLLGRLAPERVLLTLSRALPRDPALESEGSSPDAVPGSPGHWIKNLLQT
jgi:Mrp family chromosome partitioning ATPase